MTRALAITLALLVAAAPFSAASAQDRGRRGDYDRGPRQEQSRDQGREGRQISEAQAQSIAQSRARGARFVGSRGMQGGSYVFVFDDNGRIFQISVSASGN